MTGNKNVISRQRGDERGAEVLAMDGFRIYSGDIPTLDEKPHSQDGEDRIPSWMAVMSEIGRNVPQCVVTTGSVGLNSRCPRGGSPGVSCSELSLGGLWQMGPLGGSLQSSLVQPEPLHHWASWGSVSG